MEWVRALLLTAALGDCYCAKTVDALQMNVIARLDGQATHAQLLYISIPDGTRKDTNYEKE